MAQKIKVTMDVDDNKFDCGILIDSLWSVPNSSCSPTCNVDVSLSIYVYMN